MSTSAPDEPSLGQEEVGRGPGARLREARERVGLHVEDVAARLHLDRHTIEGLEADQFDNLPAPTFVRGYLRAYARLLDLPHAPLIEAFDRRGLAPPALIADIATGQEARSSDLPMRAATWGIVAILVVLAVVWWQNQQVDEGVDPMSVVERTSAPGAEYEPNRDTPRANESGATDKATAFTFPTPDQSQGVTAPGTVAQPQSETSSPAPRVAGGGVTQANPGTSPKPTLPTNSTTGETLPAPSSTIDPDSAAPASGNVSPNRAPSTAANQPDNASTAQSSPTSSEPASVPDSQNSSGANVAGSQAASETTGGTTAKARVMLSFRADSWVEIHDSADQRLYFNLAKAGRKVDVSGQPPIRVLIGYVEGVEMEYNGRPYDFSAHIRKGVARFEVGKN